MLESQVTVLIPSYNPGRYLKEALDSVFSQTFKYWKVVVVDDASTDDSLSKIEVYLKDPRVKLIRNSVNVGQSKTQNEGLKMINTPWTIMLDSDDWYFPHTLEVLMNEAQLVADDVALICGNKMIVYEDERGNKVKEVPRIGGRTFSDRYDFLLSNYVPYPRLYRTTALKQVGGWPTNDPYEGRYLEDNRMDLMLIEYYRIQWIDQMLYNYRRHTNNITNQLDRINEMYEWNIRDALKRWGDHFEPVFNLEDGWLFLRNLIPKN